VICGWRNSSANPLPIANTVTRLPPLEDRVEDPVTAHTMQTRASLIMLGGRANKGINVTSVRHAHTDVAFPDFTAYRRTSCRDPTKMSRDTEPERRLLTHAMTFGIGGMLTLYAGKQIAHTVVAYKWMAKDIQALAAVEIDLGEVPEGKTKTFEWRGKPIFVRHRTSTEITREQATPIENLRHPQKDSERVQKDEWSVLIGVCTHLGCVPIAGLGDFHGYYCPCHGSHYDASGRIRKGPAPLNLHVPPYMFKDDSTIIVGKS